MINAERKVTAVKTKRYKNSRHFASKMFKNKLDSCETMDQLINMVDDPSLKINVI